MADSDRILVVRPSGRLLVLSPQAALDVEIAARMAGDDALDARVDALEGQRVRHARVGTGNVPAGTSTEIIVPWPQAFADVNYTPVASVFQAGAAATNTLTFRRIRAQSAADIRVVVVNNDPLNPQAGMIFAYAIHD